MDLQAQDRCHRIGQTREVHIYRLVTEHTIEENIWKKSQQKRQMNDVVIGDGQFNTEYLEKLDPRELLGVDRQGERTSTGRGGEGKEQAKVEEVDDDAEVAEEEEEEPSLSKVTGRQDEYSVEEVQALMMNLEDESDRTALIAVQAEQEAERAEFGASSTSPLSPSLPHQPPRPSRPSVSSVYAKLSGHHSASFESALTPVQRYALFFAEHVDPIVTEKQISKTAKLMEKEEHKWEAQQHQGLSRATPSPPLPAPPLPLPPPPPPPQSDVMEWGKEEKGEEEHKAGAPLPVVKQEPGVSPISASVPLNVLGNRETLILTHLTHPHPPPSTPFPSPPSTDLVPSRPSAPSGPARSFKRKRVTFEDAEVLQYVDAYFNDPHYNDPQPTLTPLSLPSMSPYPPLSTTTWTPSTTTTRST